MTWLSPAFPVGAYSYSHGLEYLISDGLVSDEKTLEAWIGAGLAFGFGRIDGAIFCASYRATSARDCEALTTTLEIANAIVPTREFELETLSQGRAFWSTVRDVWQNNERVAWAAANTTSSLPYPFAVGAAAAAGNVPLHSALVCYFHAVASNLVSAGVRLIPLGQTAGQRVLAALEERVTGAAETAMGQSLDDVGSAAPLFEWASIRHETQYTRLFRS
jgi:urease accessory protein